MAVVLLLAFSAVIGIALWEKEHSQFSGQDATTHHTLTYQGLEYEFRQDIETILLLGLDSPTSEETTSYNDRQKVDFLLLLVIDRREQTLYVISINRDTMADMNELGLAGDKMGTVTQQIALAYTYGNGREVSCRNTANAVSGLLKNVTIDHYLSITMEGISLCHDMLDGVTLEILDDLTHVDSALVKGETVTLSAVQALTYIRAGQDPEDPANASRLKRQQQYVEALYTRMRDAVKDDRNLLVKVALKLSSHMISDCSINKLKSLLERLTQYELREMWEMDGQFINGGAHMEFYPDEESLMEIVIKCFCQEKKERD